MTQRHLYGKRLVRIIGISLIVSSFVKFVQPGPVVDYMGSMGFQDTNYFIVASIELAVAIALLLPATSWAGVLLASAYFGGAVAAHLATHRYVEGGPFLVFMATHPLVGALVPIAFLSVLWYGVWLLAAAAPDRSASARLVQTSQA